MSKNKDVNIGGINGLGESLVNTNSQEFKELKSLIKASYNNQTEEEKIQNGFVSIRLRMEAYLNTPTDMMVSTGAFIEEYLKIIGIKKNVFAKYIGYEDSNLSALIKGRRKINTDTAIKLGKIFKVPPVIWLSIENKNDLMNEMHRNEEKYAHFSLNDLIKKAS